MPEEQPYVHFFSGKECWVKEELVSAAGLAYLAGIDGVLRLRDEVTGITLNVAVDGTDRRLFLARGRIGLTVEPVSVKRISSEATSELFAISVKQDGRTLLAGVGNPGDLLPSDESAPPPDAVEEPAEESSLFFEVSITDSEGREVVADSGTLWSPGSSIPRSGPDPSTTGRLAPTLRST